MELLLDIDEKLCKCGCGASLENRRPNVLFATKKCRDEYNNRKRAKRLELKKHDRRHDEFEAWCEYDLQHPEVRQGIDQEARTVVQCAHEPNIGAIIEYRIRMWMGIPVPNAFKKFYAERWWREHPEYANLFNRSHDLRSKA